MSKVKLHIFTMLIGVLLLASGCGAQEEDDGKELQSTPEPTLEAAVTEEPALESTPQSTPKLTEQPTPEPTEQPLPESTPEPAATTEPVEEFVDKEDITTDMEAVFASALDYLVPEEDADAAAKVSNAIIKKTGVQVNDVSNTECNVTIRYPDAAEALRSADAELSAEATEEQIKEMLLTVAQAIEAEEVTMIEENFDVVIVEMDGMRTIQWTPQLYNAVTGGLYSTE